MNYRLDDGQIEVIDDALAEVLRAKTPWDRVRMVSECQRTARSLAAGGVRLLHPDWTDVQVEAEVRRRMTRGAD